MRASSEVQPLVDAVAVVECLVTAVFEVLGMGPFVQPGLRFAGLKVLQVLVLRGVTVQLASRSDVFCIWGLSLPLTSIHALQRFMVEGIPDMCA